MFHKRAELRLSEPERALAQRLHGHVDMLAGLIGPRHMGRPTSLEAAAAYVRRELGAIDAGVCDESYDVEGRRACNFIVERSGTRRPGEIVILGAHYDSLASTPGADDNASAVAVLIEAMRLLDGRNFDRTVRFVAFTNEEPPHFFSQTMGSQVHARGCRMRGENIVGMLCMEMVGFFNTAPNSQTYPPMVPKLAARLLPHRGDFIAMVSNMASAKLLLRARAGFRRSVRFPLVAMPLPQQIPEIRLSDHGPFWDEGFPALMITDTSFFRNPHYHLATDTPDTLDYPRMSRVTQGVAGALAHVADA